MHLSKNETPSSFVKHLDLLSGTSVSSKMGLILVRNIFNYFNFYSIDIQDGFWYDVRLSVHMMPINLRRAVFEKEVFVVPLTGTRWVYYLVFSVLIIA